MPGPSRAGRPLGDAPRVRTLGWLLTIATIAGISLLTLVPITGQGSASAATPFLCVVCGPLGGVDVLLNVILFLPFGVGLVLAGARLRTALVAAAVFTLCIELLQWRVIPGRDASLSDLLTNSAGGMLGALVAHRLPRWIAPAPAHARRLGIVAAGAWLLVQAFTAWGVGIAPPPAPWFGQYAPRADNFPSRFTGWIGGARLGTVTVPDSPIDDVAGARRALLEGAPFVVDVVPASTPRWTAAIVRVADSAHREVIVLGQIRRSLFLRVRMRVAALRLRVPPVRLDDAMPLVQEGAPRASLAPVRLVGGVADRHLVMRVETASGVREARIAPSPSWGWSFLLPLENYALGGEARWLTALWIAGLLLPAAYWLRHALASRIAFAGAMTGIAVGGLAIVPIVAGLAPVHWSEWLAAAVAAGAAATLGRASRRSGTVSPADAQ